MWKKFGRVFNRSFIAKPTKVLTLLGLGTSLSYMMYHNPLYKLEETNNNQFITPKINNDNNIISVPSSIS